MTHYPNRYYSLEYADGTLQTGTSTTYVWAGDALVAYAERAIVSGSPSGSATTYYVHPDHLGSASAVTDGSGGIVTQRDWMPYGSGRVSAGPGGLGRGFIGQFEDAASGCRPRLPQRQVLREGEGSSFYKT